MNSFGLADAQQISEVAAGLAVPAFEGLSAPLLAELEEHRDACSKLKATIGYLADAPTKALAACQSGDFGDVFGIIDCARVNRAELCQQLTQAWAKKKELAERCGAELRAQLPAAEAEYAAVVESIKEKLTAIGSGVESYSAYRDNQAAASQQFHWDACNKNSVAKAAEAVVQNLRARVGGAQEHVHAAVRGAAHAKHFIERMVARLVSA